MELLSIHPSGNLTPTNQAIKQFQDPSSRQVLLPAPLCHQQSKMHKKSFIDDLTLLEKVSLNDLQQKARIKGTFTTSLT